jgi:hypothetical protein
MDGQPPTVYHLRPDCQAIRALGRRRSWIVKVRPDEAAERGLRLCKLCAKRGERK